MTQHKKDAKILNIKLATPVHDKLQQFCNENGVTKTAAVEKILDQYLDEYLKKPKDKRSLFDL